MTLYKNSLSTLLKSALLCIGLSACADRSAPEGMDYQVNHPVTVEREQVSISFANDLSKAALNGTDTQRLNRFLSDYIQRGRGPVVVEGPNGLRAQETLIAAGLNQDEVSLFEGAAEGVTILTYSAYAMKVPTCGDWSGRSSFTPNNQVHSNYGCAFQRNIGLMISDPGDWVQSQIPGNGPLGRSDVAIDGLSGAEPATDGAATDGTSTDSTATDAATDAQ